MTSHQIPPSSQNPAQGAAERVVVLEGWIPPESATYDTTSLLYLPFDVPEGVTRIHIRRDLDPHVRQTVALLVFDPRGGDGLVPDFAGFRGYQGAVNVDTECVLTGAPDTTTPWYAPGPLPAGRWNLAQWAMKPIEGGMGYRYTVTMGFDGPPPPSSAENIVPWPEKAAVAASGWVMGSLHNHTVYSYDARVEDEARTPRDLVAENRAAGIRFIAITDHNQVRAHRDLAAIAAEFPDMLLLAGNELTTLNGHAGIIGGEPDTLFDFRLDPGDARIRAIREAARAQGAFFIVNHPYATCMDCGWRYREEVWESADAIEVWNREWNGEDRQGVDAWDALLKAGRRIPMIGGSDYHRGENTFTPVMWANVAELSRAGVLDALRRGRAFVSESPTGPRLFLSDATGEAISGDTVAPDGLALAVSLRVLDGAGLTARFIWTGGEAEQAVSGIDATLRLDVPATGTGYVRAELFHPDGRMAALTNPIYVVPRPGE